MRKDERNNVHAAMTVLLQKEARKRATPSIVDKIWGPLSLFALSFQNTALVLLMKHSYRKGAEAYSTASVVATAELLKFFLCLLCVIGLHGRRLASEALKAAPRQFTLAFPCFLYTIQSNLLFQAVHSLPVSVYVVCSQGKIVTSAIFSYFLLGTLLDKRRILALALLIYGMILVQTPSDDVPSVRTRSNSGKVVGLLSIMSANLTSGFAGAFLEKIYKSSSSTSVWLKNMQLACFSVPFAFIAALTKDYETIGKVGYFAGYDATVIGVVALHAVGGLIVAVVMRYASTVLKCFAVSLSICMCTVLSAADQSEFLDAKSVSGILVVNLATFLYGIRPPNSKPDKFQDRIATREP